MKNIVYIFILLTNLTFGQTVKLTEPEIEKYARSIDKLKAENKLVKVSYFNKSRCGGGQSGYYLNKKLVYIESFIGAEAGANYYDQYFYFDNEQIVKIKVVEHHSDWEKYDQMYSPEKFEFDPTKMTYNDTAYILLFSEQPTFKIIANNKLIDIKINQTIVDRLINCGQEMKFELQEVINRIDSLKFVKEMPYICETGICGDKLYWEAVNIGRSNIELLIDKLDDTTSTTANVTLFGGTYTVADIAFDALAEIIRDIPTFKLLGVPFDKDGCGYCSYWQHLNKKFSNRQKFKEAVRDWYHKNKDNLVWVTSNEFATCDCKGIHPNGGHYKLKTDTK